MNINNEYINTANCTDIYYLLSTVDMKSSNYRTVKSQNKEQIQIFLADGTEGQKLNEFQAVGVLGSKVKFKIKSL